MPERSSAKMGLIWPLFGSVALALVLLLSALLLIVPWTVRYRLDEGQARRARAMAGQMVEMMRGQDANPRQAVQAYVDRVSRLDSEVRFVLAAQCAGRQCATTSRWVRVPTDEALVTEVRDGLAVGPGYLERRTHEALLVGRSEGESLRSVVVVGLDRRETIDVTSNLRWVLLFALAIGFVLFLGSVWLLSRQLLVRPLSSMVQVARRLSDADLSAQVDPQWAAELSALGEGLNRISGALRDTLGRVRGVSDAIGAVIEQLGATGTTVSSGASTVLTRVEETSSSMVEMMASLRSIAENVERLYQSAEESSSSIMEMAATNDEVAENVQAMAASVEETTGAIERMTYWIREVAKNVEELLASTKETSSSMSEMDVSIGQVESNANETARLSEQVSRDADQGVESLRKTLNGIDKIKESSRIASSVIEQLGKRSQEIGNILNVIDDVAEQTNLLALNAAIIAAQAGEHGKGFAVVAEEIKDLAERTGASTKEIADLIGSVQDEARNAVAAMNQGVRNVEEGVQLGREAEDALRKIFESANKSTMMVKAIARATVEQARGSKQVTASIQRIATTVQQISGSIKEQARGSEQIMKSAERMKLITAHVQRSSQEQAHGSKQITQSIESINEMATHLNRAQKEQTKGAEQVLKAVETIKAVSEHQDRSVKHLEDAIEALRQQADVLRSEVRRFRV